MFTGIIQETGRVADTRNMGGAFRITVDAAESAKRLGQGESICISGACQTVVERTASGFTVETVEETLSKTTLGELHRGSRVNLETPLRLGDPFGGHIVQGHVDGVGTVRRIEKRPDSWMFEIEIPNSLSKYTVPAGSIGIDGISLTIASIRDNRITLSIIPHTMEHTTFAEMKVGTRVNVECDILGKYVERLLTGGGDPMKPDLTRQLLGKWGYDSP